MVNNTQKNQSVLNFSPISPMQDVSLKHLSWVDFLRIFSCFLVILIHVSAEGWYNADVISKNWLFSNIYCAIGHISIPIFVMISGMFFLDERKEISVQKLLLKNTLRLFIIYCCASAFYGLYNTYKLHYILGIPQSFRDILNAILSPHTYLWFLPMMMGLYFITPLLRIVTREGGENKKILEYFLLLFFFFQIIRSTLLGLNFYSLANQALGFFNFQTIANYIGYYILGYYLFRYGLSDTFRKFFYFAAFPSIVCSVLLSAFQALQDMQSASTLFDSFSLFTFIPVIAIFLFFMQSISKISCQKRGRAILKEIGSCTLGIYLIHAFVINILTEKGLTISVAPAIFSIPFITLLVFFSSLGLTLLFRRIPYIGKYIC